MRPAGLPALGAGGGRSFALLLRLWVCFSLRLYTNTPQAGVVLYRYVHKGLLLFLCGNHQLHLGKLDAHLGPTVIAGGRGQSGLLRGQGHSAPL